MLPLLKELTNIDELLQNSITSFEPSTRDAPKFRMPRNSVYTVTNSVVLNALTGSTTLEVDATYSFSLNSISNGADFAAVFDQWRIKFVTMQFIPVDTKISSGTNAPLWTVIDYDDSNSATIATLQQYDTKKICPCGEAFERNLEPRCALALYSGAFTSFGLAPKKTWVDAASPGVLWYGVKAGIPISANPPQWQVVADITYQFRNTR